MQAKITLKILLLPTLVPILSFHSIPLLPSSSSSSSPTSFLFSSPSPLLSSPLPPPLFFSLLYPPLPLSPRLHISLLNPAFSSLTDALPGAVTDGLSGPITSFLAITRSSSVFLRTAQQLAYSDVSSYENKTGARIK